MGNKFTNEEEILKRFRILERQIEKQDLRMKQMLVMLKLLLDKAKGRKKVKMPQLLNWIDELVKAQLPEADEREPVDLVQEIIRKRAG